MGQVNPNANPQNNFRKDVTVLDTSSRRLDLLGISTKMQGDEMTRSMTSSTEKKLLELIANMVGFEYLMYVPASFPHRSGLLYKRENVRLAVWNPLVDDGDLFRLALAAPAVNLQEIINSVSQSCRDSLEIRCAFVREAFVQTLASIVVDSCGSDDSGSVGSGTYSGEGRR